MTLRGSILTALLPAVLLTGCGGGASAPRPSDGPAPVRLAKAYVATAITEAGSPRALVRGSRLRITFEDGRIGINAGCNGMAGTYRLDRDRLRVSTLSSTEMGCAPALMAQDGWVAGLFTGPVTVSAPSLHTLVLSSGRVRITLTDQGSITPARPLTGTVWLLDSVIGAATTSSVPAGVVAYLRIQGTTLTVYDGCNTGTGSVRVDADRIRFGQRVQTLIGCLRPEVGEVGRAVADVLGGTAAYRIEGDALTITRGTRGLGFHAVARVPALG